MATPPSLPKIDVLAKFEEIAGKLTQTRFVALGDHSFEMVSLSASQDTEAHEAANPYSKIAYLYALKLESLARSIFRVDKIDIPEVVETGQHFRGVPQRKVRHLFLKEVLGKFPQEVIDVLYREYGLLAMDVAKTVERTPEGAAAPPRATDKELKSLQEADIREAVEREVEERRADESASAEAGGEGEHASGADEGSAGAP